VPPAAAAAARSQREAWHAQLRPPRALAALAGLALVALLAAHAHRGGRRWASGWTSIRSSAVQGLAGVIDRHWPSEAAAEVWTVAWKSGVNVRSRKSVASEVLGVKNYEDSVRGRREGNWLALEGEPGYIIITLKGTGTLLRRAAWTSGETIAADGAPFALTDEEREQVNDPATCHTAAKGDACYKNVSWARTEGIGRHADWYPGLGAGSSFGDFQVFLHRRYGGCPLPCQLAFSPHSCAAYGCVRYKPSHACQCNPGCKAHGSCCADFGDSCAASTAGASTAASTTASPPKRHCNFKYFKGGPAQCFCHLAGNAGCAGSKCPCPQGCSGNTWKHLRSVTFRNLAKARGCASTTALLTIPRSYFANIQALRAMCPIGMRPLLAEMLRGGFQVYQKTVATGAVKQCIHAANSTSQPWLHVHTVCAAGGVDNMFATSASSWCGVMSKAGEAEALVKQIAAWAGGA